MRLCEISGQLIVRAIVTLVCVSAAVAAGRAGMAAPARTTDTAPPAIIDVTRVDRRFVRQPLIRNDRSKARQNTQRMETIMRLAPAGAVIRFPAGDFYFDGGALPNRGSVETSAPGQVITGEGADVTHLIQTNSRPFFGFIPKPGRKTVPVATVRIRHKGCRLRQLSVLPDPQLPVNTILPSAAVQLAHIAYYPDHNVGIIETTGQGADYLLDFVDVTDISIGRHLGHGIQSERFFDVGIDIIGSGGECKVRNVARLDARIGVRLDNGNHCGQGGYYFDNLEMIGRHGVTDGGVFFDWVGGQAPFIRNCTVGFTSGLHIGPLGVHGDRLEPYLEAEVIRRTGSRWDWMTLHAHSVPDQPNHAQRTEWYGLPRHAVITRIGSQPRTGGVEWREGVHYRVERVQEPSDVKDATRIHWLTGGPADGQVYYVEFQQPIEYRVHDLQWGYLINCQLGEALQSGADAFTVKVTDQGYGHLNPDFGFSAGYGFFITGNMILNGPLVFDGRVDCMRIEGNTTGVCDIVVQGRGADRRATRLSFRNNTFNHAVIGDWVSQVQFDGNETGGSIRVNAPHSAEFVSFTGNTFISGDRSALEIGGTVRSVRVEGNTLRLTGRDGVVLSGCTDVIVSRNMLSGAPGRGLGLTNCDRFLVTDNLLHDCDEGLVITGSPQMTGQVRGNSVEGCRTTGMRVDPAPGVQR